MAAGRVPVVGGGDDDRSVGSAAQRLGVRPAVSSGERERDAGADDVADADVLRDAGAGAAGAKAHRGDVDGERARVAEARLALVEVDEPVEGDVLAEADGASHGVDDAAREPGADGDGDVDVDESGLRRDAALAAHEELVARGPDRRTRDVRAVEVVVERVHAADDDETVRGVGAADDEVAGRRVLLDDELGVDGRGVVVEVVEHGMLVVDARVKDRDDHALAAEPEVLVDGKLMVEAVARRGRRLPDTRGPRGLDVLADRRDELLDGDDAVRRGDAGDVLRLRLDLDPVPVAEDVGARGPEGLLEAFGVGRRGPAVVEDVEEDDSVRGRDGLVVEGVSDSVPVSVVEEPREFAVGVGRRGRRGKRVQGRAAVRRGGRSGGRRRQARRKQDIR
ncbi:MAG: hypothetical protein HYT80_04880 [Euryarchaeota archaeon]|nr:hypothetical protein [Euryarchaeota archaeon]